MGGDLICWDAAGGRVGKWGMAGWAQLQFVDFLKIFSTEKHKVAFPQFVPHHSDRTDVLQRLGLAYVSSNSHSMGW